MPLRHRLARLGDHIVPVLHLSRPRLGPDHDLADQVVLRQAVVVHAGDVQARFANALERHVEDERLVEDGVQCALLDARLLLLDALLRVVQPQLHVRVCNGAKTNRLTQFDNSIR